MANSQIVKPSCQIFWYQSALVWRFRDPADRQSDHHHCGYGSILLAAVARDPAWLVQGWWGLSEAGKTQVELACMVLVAKGPFKCRAKIVSLFFSAR
jgi:hypothetical protein